MKVSRAILVPHGTHLSGLSHRLLRPLTPMRTELEALNSFKDALYAHYQQYLERSKQHEYGWASSPELQATCAREAHPAACSGATGDGKEHVPKTESVRFKNCLKNCLPNQKGLISFAVLLLSSIEMLQRKAARSPAGNHEDSQRTGCPRAELEAQWSRLSFWTLLALHIPRGFEEQTSAKRRVRFWRLTSDEPPLRYFVVRVQISTSDTGRVSGDCHIEPSNRSASWPQKDDRLAGHITLVLGGWNMGSLRLALSSVCLRWADRVRTSHPEGCTGDGDADSASRPTRRLVVQYCRQP